MIDRANMKGPQCHKRYSKALAAQAGLAASRSQQSSNYVPTEMSRASGFVSDGCFTNLRVDEVAHGLNLHVDSRCPEDGQVPQVSERLLFDQTVQHAERYGVKLAHVCTLAFFCYIKD